MHVCVCVRERDSKFERDEICGYFLHAAVLIPFFFFYVGYLTTLSVLRRCCTKMATQSHKRDKEVEPSLGKCEWYEGHFYSKNHLCILPAQVIDWRCFEG
jgi:hypothetical protein